MRNILFDVLEINIVMALVIVLLRLFAGKIRKRYGAMWLKLMWIVLMVRLLIPYNFSLPATEFRLFNVPGFEQEIAENAGSNVLNNNEQNVWPELNGDAMQSDGVSQNVSNDNTDPYVQENNFGGEGSQMNSEGGAGDTAVMNPENAEGNAGGVNNENAEGNAGGMNSENTGSDAEGVGYAGVGSTDHIVTDVADGAEDARKPGVFRYTDILLYIWLIGIGGSAVYHVAVYLVMRRTYMKDLEPVQNESLQEEIDKLQNKYLGQKKLTVYESKQVQSPLITGILHPKLIIPSYEGDWNADELELITAHELCHYHKKDLWLKMLMLAVTCFNWFNPAVYMMKKQFYYDMELVCDESVMRGRSKEEKETYAKILMSYAGKGRRNYTFMSGLAAGSKLTKNRIYHIWEDGQKKKGVIVFATVLVGFVGIGLFVSCGYKPGEVGKDADSVSVDLNKPVEGDSISYGDEVSFAWKDVEGLCFQCPGLNGDYPTWLYVSSDGSFTGGYKELYPEDTGENYPDGTIYLCNFDGKFAEPKKINSYTYSLEVSTMTYEEHIGSHIKKDDLYYYYVPPMGLYDLEELVLYTPGAPLRELPVAFLESVGYQALSLEKDATLPFYAIYNVKEEKGFLNCGTVAPEEIFVDTSVVETDESGNALLYTMQYEVQPGELCQIKLYGKMLNEYNYGISYVEITSEDGEDYSFSTEEAMTEMWGQKTVYTECWSKDGGIKLEDINFDGYVDIGLMAQTPAYNLPYIYYVFDADNGKYEYYDDFMCYLKVDTAAETCLEEYRAGTTYYKDLWAKDNEGGLYLMQRTIRDYDYATGEFTDTTEYYSLDG
ncbi:MAG: hypothetical protein J6A80_08250 [Lachnospiraceae bacterium]|nr:hypothetical protein [Lachnospiraceae bacterium]